MSDKEAKYLTLADLNKALPKETAEKYKVVNIPKKRASYAIFSAKHGEVNFKKLSPARAAQLVKQNFPYLEKVKATK